MDPQIHGAKRQKMPESEYEKYKKILENNKHFVEKTLQEDPEYFKNLSQGTKKCNCRSIT